MRDQYPVGMLMNVRSGLTDHCIEMLRIAIMCESDVTPITLYVPDYQDDPTPDFSTMHTCRNFDRILEYVHENTMDYSLAD